MDQANQNRTCKKHTNSNLEFIQVKNVNQNTNKNMFYCSSCINQDLSFKGVDHILIHQIVIEGDTHIIQKWPPIDNQQIIEQLIQVTTDAQSHSTAEHTITNFFNSLKDEISDHIDTCQKKMVNLIKHQSFDGESILTEYQSISQIKELRKLLLSGNQADLYAKEQSCKEFILQIEEKNDENTDKLQDLLKKSQRKQSVLDLEFPNQIKQSILNFVDQINFFQSDQYNHNMNDQENSFSEKLMKLISNKSNFCSDKFLKEIRVKISQLNILLSSLSFENQFKEDKNPMQFQDLTNEQLDLLGEQVKHLSRINRDSEYIDEVKNSKGVNSMKSVVNIKTNLIEKKFINEFEGYLIETYPYLRSLDFENMKVIIDQKNIYDLLINFGQRFQFIFYYFSFQEFLRSIINVFLNIKQQENLMPSLQLEKGNYNNGQYYLMINKQNNQIEIENKQGETYWMNCISNITLEKNKKYIFRFSFQKLDNGQKNFMIGLMKAGDIHNQQGYNNKLSCQLYQQQNSNDVELYNSKWGISQKVSGNQLKMNTNNNEEIELRVCLQEQVLQILDYPHYTFKYELEDQFKQNLIIFPDLKLYISQHHINQKIILKSAYIVKSW